MAGSRILVAEYPSKPGGCGIWYKLPNGNKQTAFPKAELEAFFRSQNLDIEIQFSGSVGVTVSKVIRGHERSTGNVTLVCNELD